MTYAGGDDLLALANLKDLLPMLKGLREKFPGFTTASAGVCIAHHKVPLGAVFQQARRMEKVAKQDGRDRLGMTLLKHSGNISEAVTGWKYEDLDVIAISQALVDLLRDDEVSKRFLYDFRETFFLKLIKDDADYNALGRQLIQTEFRRIMERAHSTKGTLTEVNEKTIDLFARLIPYVKPFSHFLGYLEIVNFIARTK